MIDYILFSLFTAFVVNGMHAAGWSGMILSPLAEYALQRPKSLLYYILKPLLLCVYCMCPWYAIAVAYVTGLFPTLEAFLCGLAAMPIAGYINAKLESL